MNSDTENTPEANNTATAKDKKAKNGSQRRNKVLLPTILFLIVLPISIFALSQEKSNKIPEANTNQSVDSPIVLYYSDKCPHCKDLEKWIEENNIQSKTTFARKEVGANRQNAEELIKRAGACNISEDEIGVPFLWDGNTQKCLIGYDQITAYFQGKTSSGTNATLQGQSPQNNAEVTNKTKEK